ncbi:MADS-box protein FBP24 [Nicotiana tabacum]|uniref:MADS-box protein FBP24 n=3 Tax=Nicotiana TaxID=4085 RepID=A0A1S3X444_TOBAC|nr:PREDICTED: MADS-box protein FBP24 isoform X1 [Nicotiana sylvestris]XP_009785851.1 PREDICTED: MADS-box protein FBP24 isoform X1 [Nicotiana sylvestris]XP_009785852.1 PREDICTED: MADS-box protein FBP24 isoform X2 [Nicotiana sylvestris]XP_016434468.1 PREDICTED: MADS-box protein FBP24-like [Nicotiana tabacum]
MGRGKIEVKRIENKTSRQVTFSKRRAGLLKKTHELSVLCDAQIGLIIFSTKGKLFEYSSQPHSMSEIISRYLQTTGASIPVQDNRVELYDEITKMKRDTLNLQLSLQKYKGDDLSSAQYEELNELEKQLEFAVNKVRARKHELMLQQMENLRRTEKMLEKDNQEMYQWLMSNQMYKQQSAGMEHNDDDQNEEAITELNLMGEQPLLSQFSFFGEEQVQPSSSNVLQLAAASTSTSAYRLQSSHPNLQDSDLPGCNYAHLKD